MANDETNCHQWDITIQEIKEAIAHIGSYKAEGHDNIHNMFIKNGGNMLVNCLHYLFNWSYSIGYFPEFWKQCNIIPIPKPERDHSKCKNHRPIALLSCIGKLMERIVSRRLLWY